jgi:hypothetical protein
MEGTSAEQSGPESMKLSIEAKVAVAIAIAFAALSIGAIAQEGSGHGTVSEISSTQNGIGENQLFAQY